VKETKVNVKGTIVPNDDKWIYNWLGMDATSPKDISDAIEKANGETLDVDINSPGGDVDSGSEIYTALRGYSGTRIHIVGACASAASVVAMAGWSEMSPTARMMVHLTATYSEGNHHDMDLTSEALQKADRAIASAYVAKSGMSEKDAITMMDKTTYLTAQEAVDLKLVDKVMFSDQTAVVPLAASASGLLPKAVLDKVRNLYGKEKQTEKFQTELNFLKEKVI
jgi:ATP-dependent protease ClpP protease subunit